MHIITVFNHFVLHFFEFLYKYCNFESLEDKFHKHKKEKKSMNKVKFEFVKENESVSYTHLTLPTNREV